MAPLVVVSFIFCQRWQASGEDLPPGPILQLAVLGTELVPLWMLFLALVSTEVDKQTFAITRSRSCQDNSRRAEIRMRA